MPTFTVHAPPPKNGVESAPERFRFVRDGFHFWAFLVSPLWLIAKRQWLALLIYLVLIVALGVLLALVGVPSRIQSIATLLIGLLVGFEASSIQRWTLSRRRWTSLGFVVGDDQEEAERRFYAGWTKRAPVLGIVEAPIDVAPPATMSPRASTPSDNDVIGLFPQPGGAR